MMEATRQHSRSKEKGLFDGIRSLEWKNPSCLGIVNLVIYFSSLIFYVIAICTNHWAEITSEKGRANVGLWSACTTLENGDVVCSRNVFDFFLVNDGSQWEKMARVFMGLGLFTWFCEEFAVIGSVFLVKTPRIEQHLVAMNVVFSGTSGLCLYMTLVMAASELSTAPDSDLSWSFFLAVFSLLGVIASAILTMFLLKDDMKISLPF